MSPEPAAQAEIAARSASGTAYRKLPGHRRGFIRGASLWMGTDHLLLVRSYRFREEYKRFHLRDIQAIVVARGPRFHISTRAVALAALWVALYVAAGTRVAWGHAMMWGLAVGLVGWWLLVSASWSCFCRIYTAVSRDDLPSIYRTWTARRFLAEVEPRIREVQGAIEGGWAEAVEERNVGPPAFEAAGSNATTYAESGVAEGDLPQAGAGPAAGSLPAAAARSHTLAFDIFLAMLFASGSLNLLTLHSVTQAVQWVIYGLAFIEISTAILIILEHRRGVLRAGMQRLAVISLLSAGAFFYLRQIVTSVGSAAKADMPEPGAVFTNAAGLLLRQIDAGASLMLGVVGLVLIFLPRRQRETPGERGLKFT